MVQWYQVSFHSIIEGLLGLHAFGSQGIWQRCRVNATGQLGSASDDLVESLGQPEGHQDLKGDSRTGGDVHSCHGFKVSLAYLHGLQAFPDEVQRTSPELAERSAGLEVVCFIVGTGQGRRGRRGWERGPFTEWGRARVCQFRRFLNSLELRP